MRILQISSARNFGGGEHHFVDLCRGLHERGHEVYVAVRPTNLWLKRLEFLPPERFLLVSIRNSFGVFSAKRISDFVRDNKIEIVHAHVARDYIPAHLACSLVKGAKFILTRHVLFPLKPFNRFALRNLSMAIAVSPPVEACLRSVFPASRIRCVPNAIDVSHWSGGDHALLRDEFRSFHNIPAGVPLIGIIGELIELKGQREFVIASQEIAKLFPEARFVVVGKDNSMDRSFRRELKRLAGVFGLEDKYLWLDWVDDTAPLLAAMDVFVSASHSESFGLAMLEAMACGTPVVATSTEGALELVRDDELLVPIADPVSLAAKVNALLSDRKLCERKAAELQRRAAENYSLDRMLEQTLAVYREALELPS